MRCTISSTFAYRLAHGPVGITADMDDLLEKQCEYVRSALKATGWNGARLAKEAGLSASTVNRPLKPRYKGHYSLATLYAIAKASRVPLPAGLLSPGAEVAVNTPLGNVSQSRDVSTGGVLMSEEEERLLKIYRKLDADNRALILQKVTALFIDRQADDPAPLSTRRRA